MRPKRILSSFYGGPERDSIFRVTLSANQLLCCSPEREAVYSAETWGGLSVACHASILNVTAVGFAPAGELALVDGVLGAYARHVVHPDQTRTYRQKDRRCLNCFQFTFNASCVTHNAV